LSHTHGDREVDFVRNYDHSTYTHTPGQGIQRDTHGLFAGDVNWQRLEVNKVGMRQPFRAVLTQISDTASIPPFRTSVYYP